MQLRCREATDSMLDGDQRLSSNSSVQVASLLASLALVVVFVIYWYGRSDGRHLADDRFWRLESVSECVGKPVWQNSLMTTM